MSSIFCRAELSKVKSTNTQILGFSEKLQSHHKGPLFKKFVLKNPENEDDKSQIKYDSLVIIENKKSSTVDRGFLVINKENNTVSNSSQTKDNASKFVIELKRVFEPNNRHLCINPGDTLYP